MDWTRAIDIYCERTGPEFWSEPVNAVSNLSFIVAGLLCLMAMARRGVRDGLLLVLCVIALCIGVGSFLFHTYAEAWAGVADVVPILLFIILFLVTAMNRLFGLRWSVAIPVAVAAFVVSLGARWVAISVAGGSLNGSESYAPAFALLAGSALVLTIMGRRSARPVAVAAAVFALSLTARSIDAATCDHFPLGTHFFWHLLNGTMIGILLFTLLNYGVRRPD
jgi:hypothetical protein